MTDDPLDTMAAHIKHARAVADACGAGTGRDPAVRPMLGCALEAARHRHPGVAAYYLFQATGSVLHSRDPRLAVLRGTLLDLAVSARALARWTGYRIPRDATDAHRSLRRAAPLAFSADRRDQSIVDLEIALRHLGKEVLAEPVPDRLVDLTRTSAAPWGR